MIKSKNRLQWLPIILMVSVVCSQVILVNLFGGTPWRGGGFGMFSSYDRQATRRLSILGQDKKGNHYRILVTRNTLKNLSLDPDIPKRLITLVRPEKMKTLGRKLLNQEYVIAGSKEREIIQRIETQKHHHVDLDLANEPALFIRPIVPDDILLPSNSIIVLESIRLSVWRMNLENSSALFNWELVGDEVILGEER